MGVAHLAVLKHGTYRAYFRLGCRCAECCLYAGRKRAARKDYGLSKAERLEQTAAAMRQANTRVVRHRETMRNNPMRKVLSVCLVGTVHVLRCETLECGHVLEFPWGRSKLPASGRYCFQCGKERRYNLEFDH
jgi:hypothetical protein